MNSQEIYLNNIELLIVPHKTAYSVTQEAAPCIFISDKWSINNSGRFPKTNLLNLMLCKPFLVQAYEILDTMKIHMSKVFIRHKFKDGIIVNV